jgi:hypothetical protein
MAFHRFRLASLEESITPFQKVIPGHAFQLQVRARGPDVLELAATVRRELRDRTLVGSRGSQPTADVIYVDANEMADAIRTSGTYTANAKQVTVELWLAKDKSKTHVAVQGFSGDLNALATKIVSAMFAAGERL